MHDLLIIILPFSLSCIIIVDKMINDREGGQFGGLEEKCLLKFIKRCIDD